MAILTGLQPSGVFEMFEQLCGIPHGSRNTKAISDFCVRFAQEHGLNYRQDDSNNVILFAPATPGMEQAQPVMTQIRTRQSQAVKRKRIALLTCRRRD